MNLLWPGLHVARKMAGCNGVPTRSHTKYRIEPAACKRHEWNPRNPKDQAFFLCNSSFCAFLLFFCQMTSEMT